MSDRSALQLSPLAQLAMWCDENVADGRISMCRVEPTCQPCVRLCSDCLRVETQARVALERFQDNG